MVVLKIFIDNEAKSQLRKVYSYIKRDSFQNAEKVRNGMIASFKTLGWFQKLNESIGNAA